MSTLPLNWAPSAIVTRAALTLPMTRAPDWRSTRSLAVTLPVSVPATDQRAARHVGLHGRAVLDGDALLGRELAAHRARDDDVFVGRDLALDRDACADDRARHGCLPFQRRADARPRASPCEAPPSSGGKFELAIEPAREARAVVDRHGAALQVAPDARARREAHRPRRDQVALERAGDEDRVRVDRFARRRVAPSAIVRSPRSVTLALDVALDDEIPVAVDAPAHTRAAADARIGGIASALRASRSASLRHGFGARS